MSLVVAFGAAGVPAKICVSKVSWGEGGMTERYEKSPAKGRAF